MKARASKRRQRGGALLIIAALLVLGIGWGAMTALGKTAPPGQAEREIKTAAALQAAKQALLGYVVQLAARSDNPVPGQLPCPEALTAIGGTSAGDEDTTCSSLVGRLPWRTLGIAPLYDGDAEPLWYVLSPGFRSAPLNFASTGQLPYTSGGTASNVVAIIIAPGAPLNTASAGTPPAGCSAVNQHGSNRKQAPLNAANFFECGNASGNYIHLGHSDWTNDRVIAVTTAEWIAAITPVIGDRMQREVAPAIRDWDAYELAQTGKSWGSTHGLGYLPFASDWENPAGTGATVFCGNQSTVRGLMPIESTCYDNPWTVSGLTTGGLLSLLGLGTGCTDAGSYLRCRFARILGIGPGSAQITLTASNVARAFRSTLRASDITLSHSGSVAMSASLPNLTSDATMTVNVSWTAGVLGLLAVGELVSVDVPHLQAARIHSDPRITWFRNNGWHRYTWYAVSPDATASNANPWEACDFAGGPGCLIVNYLPASTGVTNDKQLVLVLSGAPLGTQTTPSADLTQYFEAQNASLGVIYEIGISSSTFNDRVATCPFKYVDHSGANVTICN